MADVAVCPRCEGEKVVHNARSGRSETCPTCNGSGVKWRDEVSESRGSANDPLDLTYQP